ncbi:hypothetical protein ILUMI_27471 [Ignelater luminosus]|uniref:Mos1 transposase HTH domain-containing protein n=1 Tax=Ignelater luminosus TaxID=2038154 RepID=A0A8K0C642_IGNLU|nr:hypothetical protein ILUMI_27471 [Ignelater luminosus]
MNGDAKSKKFSYTQLLPLGRCWRQVVEWYPVMWICSLWKKIRDGSELPTKALDVEYDMHYTATDDGRSVWATANTANTNHSLQKVGSRRSMRTMATVVSMVTWLRDEIRTVTRYNFLRGLSIGEYVEELKNVMGDDCPHQTTVFCWYREFRRRDFSTNDVPSDVVTPEVIDKVSNLITENRQISFRQIDKTLAISAPSVHKILHEHFKVKKNFHHDNAKPHAARLTQDVLKNAGLKLLVHPPYSPDLPVCDFG